MGGNFNVSLCVIFGGNGFIGSHLAEGLLNKGHDVRIFDSFQYGTGNLSGIINKIELIKGNFLNEGAVHSALEDADYLFHYISTTNPATALKNPIFDIETNLIGSVRLFQAAVECGIKKILYPSSGGTIYGDTTGGLIKESNILKPQNPYAISKLAIEHYLRYFQHTYEMDYVVLRYSNPYGERQNPYAKQGVIPIFLNKIKNNERPVIYGDGSAIRDYIYIKDAIDATIAVLESGTSERVLNVGSGQSTSINDLIGIMSEVTGDKITPEYVDNEGIYISRIVLDISKIFNETGWKPKISLHEGIANTWKWIKTLQEI